MPPSTSSSFQSSIESLFSVTLQAMLDDMTSLFPNDDGIATCANQMRRSVLPEERLRANLLQRFQSHCASKYDLLRAHDLSCLTDCPYALFKSIGLIQKLTDGSEEQKNALWDHIIRLVGIAELCKTLPKGILDRNTDDLSTLDDAVLPAAQDAVLQTCTNVSQQDISSLSVLGDGKGMMNMLQGLSSTLFANPELGKTAKQMFGQEFDLQGIVQALSQGPEAWGHVDVNEAKLMAQKAQTMMQDLLQHGVNGSVGPDMSAMTAMQEFLTKSVKGK